MMMWTCMLCSQHSHPPPPFTQVYSVGMYCSDAIKDALAGLSKAKAPLSSLSVQNTTFLLQMNFKVGAEKMASAIADSVAPRNPSSDDVEQLKELIVSGLKGPAVKGTTLQFDCRSGEGVDVTVDGRAQGSVDSATLAEAFCNVFLDDKTVSPALRASILDNCCAE
jgi:hypothetical protein